ncbi:T9SS type B sorting domain-containing protein [Capnocytophaga cynodegmi]|uniref:T9SS type B sorting domain-containing protein n=1 Tax=Capnocytophaga cynodegmi TaxID=28189 RepID=UPI001BB30E69|nr:gliding motility-associated C-terminal domain-containing protein [Capnocytophaga cynodegmi]
MRKIIKYLYMRCLYFVFSLAFFLGMNLITAQVTFPPNGVTVTVGDNYGLVENNYELGRLNVQVQFSATADASVTITLPEGITIKPGTLKIDSGTGTISNQNSNNSVVTFTITGASGTVLFSLDKLISPEAHKRARSGTDTSYVLEDKVQVTQGSSVAEEKSKAYNYAYPILGLSNVVANNAAVMGENTSNFTIVNTGNGKATDIYLVLEYPVNITHSEVSMNGTSLTQISNTGNKYVFKIGKDSYNSGNGLSNGQAGFNFVHKYNVTARCISGEQIKYMVNWGEGDAENTWYQNSGNEASRTISSEIGVPNIEITRRDASKSNVKFDNTDFTKTYFTLIGGHCTAEGQVVGKLRVSYTNYGSNTSLGSALYKLNLYLRENRHDGLKAFHRPENARIGNATIPLTVASVPNISGTNKIYKADFSGITSDPDGANQGLADLDNDGVFDDLPSGATFVLEYDLVKNRSAVEFESYCVTSNIPGNTGFRDNLLYEYSNYAVYQTSCGEQIGGGTPNPLTGAVYLENRSFRRLLTIGDASFTPSTLHNGASSFEGRFGFGASTFYVIDVYNNALDSAKWRIQYKITLPVGVKATNIKWYNADGYPATEPSKPYDPSSVVAGRELTILAPEDNKRGYVTMDFEADCGTNVTDAINYEILLLEDYGRAQQCATKLVCGRKPIQVICEANCTNDGPIMIETSGERAENSLGWTDHTMRTRHTKTSLKTTNPLMLKRSLHHDDIEITARGRQERGITNNLYYSFTTNEGVSLNPKSIVVKFVSGSLAGTTRTLTATEARVVTSEVGRGTQLKRQTKIVWNLTPALGANILQPQDVFEVVATYQVGKYSDIDEVYLTSSVERLVGQSSYFYMLDNTGKEQYCGASLTPEMYTSLTTTFDGSNGPTQKFSGCTKTNIGGGYVAFMARRTPSSNTKLIGEFRPDRLLKQISVTLPKTLVVSNPMTYYLYTTHYNDKGNATQNTVNIPLSDYEKTESGGFVTYTLKNEYYPATKTYKLPPGLLVNHNAYSALLRIETVGSCDSPESFVEQGRVSNQPEYYDYFYHYGAIQPDGSNAPIYRDSKTFQAAMENKPGVSLAVIGNTTLKVTNLEQEIKVKLTNKNASSSAPYTWLSIPDVQGVEVLGLEELTGTTRRAISKEVSITGESMFYLGEAVLPATGKEYIMKVRLTNCTQATLKVFSGWNCSKYPAAYNQTCSSATDSKLTDSEKTITLVHSGSEIQLKRITTPNPDPQDRTRARLHMCADNWYEYEINSGGDGDVVEPRISISKEVGVTIAGVEVYYPYNTTSPSTLISRDEGGAVVYDLLPAGQVLLGRESTTDENRRKVRVRVNVKPDCDFRGGSTFGMEVLGKNTCGGSLEGTRDNAITAAIDGVAEANYKVVNTLTYSSGDANNCASGAVYEGRHSISATSGVTTGEGGRVVIRVPKGFKMVANSFRTKAQSGGFNLVDVVLEDVNGMVLPSGGTEYRIKVPKDMANDNWFTYEFTLKQPDGEKATNCGAEAKIEYYTIDTVGSVACPGGNDCVNITTATSEVKSVAVKAERASLLIKNITTNSQVKNNKEELTIQFDVENTSNIAYVGSLKISLFDDANNNGKVDENENALGIVTLANQTFSGNTTIAGLQGMVELSQEQVCRLRVKITSDENHCLCDMSDVLVPAPTTITGLVNDESLCQTASKQLEYSTKAPQYTSYRWASTDANAMSYLSADDISNPIFTYMGADITQTTNFTYVLTIRRAGGCEATQNVTVTVTPAPAAPAVSPLIFCTTATGADLLPSINSGHNWYATAKGGTPITSAQVLSTGTYYVSTTNGGCESLRAPVRIVVSANQTQRGALSEVPFCQNTGQNVTVAQLKAEILRLEPGTGVSVKIYNTTQLLGDADVITAGTTYKYTRVVANECESEQQDIVVLLGKSTTPTGDNTQKFCVAGTVAELNALYGANVKTFANAITLVALPDATNLTSATYYIRNLETGKCPSDALSVVVTIDPACIDAVDDVSVTPIDGAIGNPNVLNVLSNDILNGTTGIPISEVTITIETVANPIGGSANVPVLDPATGNVSVPSGTPAGTYTIVYKICTSSNICDTANVVVVVTAQPIDAKDDSFNPVVGVTGGTAGNVLSDNGNGTDTLGSVPATTANVDITEVKPASSINGNPNVPTLDTNTGDVNVPANTPAGTYTILYRICEKLNSTNCDTATATVVVNPTDLEAVPDDFSGTPIRGTNGGNTPSVLINDKLNGTPLNPSDVTLTWGGTTPNGFTTNTNGTITIAPNTPAGTYTLTYTICEKLNPTNCETTTVTIIVVPDVIDAKDDSFAPVVGVTGGTAGNVLSDNGNGTDTLGNVPATTANVGISVVTSASPINGNPNVPTLEKNTGEVNVPANTPAGTYTIVYRICEKLNPTNCDTATATVVVSPTDLEAVPDDFSGTPIRGTDGGNTSSVLTNDKLNGTPLNPSDVTLTWGATTPNGFTPNTDGTITIAPNTPAGTYTLTYTICEKLNPTNCETTTVTVLVTASPIVANDDDYTMYPIYTTIGGTVSTSVLVNDTFEGVTATLGTVTISNPTTPNTNIYIDAANGMVVVLPNTPVGTYTLTYAICEKANPTNCSNQANVTVVVLDVPKANDDSAITEINTPVVVNILENDQNVPTTGRVSVVGDPSRGSVQVNDGGTPNDPSDDTITYTPNLGFVGTDTFVYELCDVAGNCSNATVTIEVVAGGDIIPYNAISTNDDGSNDIFYIKGIEGYPNNTVRIYNRWGVKVFEAQGYNNTTKVFRGLSNGRVTIEAPEKLPQGTYYYIIEYVDKNNQTKRKGSWLYIKN